MANRKSATEWDAAKIRALRKFLGLTQTEMAEELGIRQQTVSEWETGAYKPRGASLRLLELLARREGFSPEAREAVRPAKPALKRARKAKEAEEDNEGEDWAPWGG